MIDLPNWLLIGAAGRNAGKTALACAVIARHHPVAALKVTVVREENITTCPRGEEGGCGVCSSVASTPWWIREETNAASPKDTSRLLTAGASPVLWLCCRRPALPQALEDLIPRVPKDLPVVVESNSLRNFVTPALFLMVRHADDPSMKPSAKAVLPYADRTVVSDGKSFDLDLDDLVFEDGTWRLDGVSLRSESPG